MSPLTKDELIGAAVMGIGMFLVRHLPDWWYLLAVFIVLFGAKIVYGGIEE